MIIGNFVLFQMI